MSSTHLGRDLISWAQHGEDIVLHRLFADQKEGFYIDIGANDPVVDSVTRLFSLRGWRGINVEPLPDLHARLVEGRPRDVNLCVAVSDRVGSLSLHEVSAATGLSTVDPALAREREQAGYALRTHTVACTTLAALCDAHARDVRIDFLKIDVEGHEAAVLKSGDFARFRPRALVIESAWERDPWHELVLSFGYRMGLDDGLNRYYVREEDADAFLPRLRWPANVGDGYVLARHLPQQGLMEAGRQWLELGPVVRSVALGLAAVKERHPALKRLVKGALGRP